MLVCNKCFNENCTCGNDGRVEIDDDILETIKVLNSKGYKTCYCCSGHANEVYCNAYIAFDKDYEFKDIPDFFYYDKKNMAIYYDDDMNKVWTRIENILTKESLVELANDSLFEWALDLEDKNGGYECI